MWFFPLKEGAKDAKTKTYSLAFCKKKKPIKFFTCFFPPSRLQHEIKATDNQPTFNASASAGQGLCLVHFILQKGYRTSLASEKTPFRNKASLDVHPRHGLTCKLPWEAMYIIRSILLFMSPGLKNVGK